MGLNGGHTRQIKINSTQAGQGLLGGSCTAGSSERRVFWPRPFNRRSCENKRQQSKATLSTGPSLCFPIPLCTCHLHLHLQAKPYRKKPTNRMWENPCKRRLGMTSENHSPTFLRSSHKNERKTQTSAGPYGTHTCFSKTGEPPASGNDGIGTGTKEAESNQDKSVTERRGQAICCYQ